MADEFDIYIMKRKLDRAEKELAEIKEENKVLVSECDRLIKEKGELLKKTADVQPVKQPIIETENMATVSDEFICKKCGIYLKDYIKVVMDEDNDGYIDEQHYEYEPKFCPECGAKVKDGEQNDS